jgi:glycosyltransferase involved in cell wall biosynthesis
MYILYLHQYFATRKGMTGTRSYEFSRHLVAKGHRVTMITSGLANQEFPVPDGKQYIESECEGIHVVPIAAAYNDPQAGAGMTGWQRMLKFYQFAWLAARIGRKLAKPDVVFATHTPLTIGLSGLALARHFDVPFVFEVRDLWPEALVNVGALKNPAAIWWLRRMAAKIYSGAKHIVALSPGMKEGIVRTGVPAEKVTVIPNGSDLDLFSPDVDGSAARERLGLGDRFAAVYFGAMGLANGLEYAIEAARILAERGNSRIVLVLHGSGGKRPDLEKMARQYRLTNVIFSNPAPGKAHVAQIIAACQACLTIYRATKEHTWSPNKMFDALAAGKPVLINVPGWLGETIENNHCGRSLDPYQPQALADALEELAAHPELCREMGKNARALAEREFARAKLADRLESVLSEAIQHGQNGRQNANPPFVSIIMPIRNEADFIERALRSILRNSYPAEKMEILVVDGMSSDGTRQIVCRLSQLDNRVRMLDNPKRIVPTAMNIGLRAARGEMFIRIDGHAEIPADFIIKSIRCLREHPQAWVAGGHIRTVADNYTGRAIASAMRSPIGVGNSRFRLGDYEGWVDTLAFGAHHKWVVDRVGYFDEELVRNQDDEFNLRIILAGGKIWMSKAIQSTYFPRGSLRTLWKQYFQYGFWRIRTLQKHKRPASLRQLVPLLFVSSLLFFGLAGLAWRPFGILLTVEVALYVVGLVMGAVDVGRKSGWRYTPVAPVIFAVLHFAYGTGSLWGGVRFSILKGHAMKKPEETQMSR